MLTLLLVISAAWLCRRALASIVLRTVAFAVGFVVGWRLMG